MNLTIPLNFGDRPCDRMLVANLSSTANCQQTTDPRARILWTAFRVWQDFGIARDDRRVVPLDPAAWPGSPAVAITESFAGWWGERGAFVAACVRSGFMTLVPVDAGTAELVLTNFFPHNRQSERSYSASRLGGIAKGVNAASKRAEAAAAEQMEFFRRSAHPLLTDRPEPEIRQGLLFIHQVCNVLHRNAPQAVEWKEALLVKSLDILRRTTAGDRDLVLRWFLANRDSQEIPARLDFVLDAFDSFFERAFKEFG